MRKKLSNNISLKVLFIYISIFILSFSIVFSQQTGINNTYGTGGTGSNKTITGNNSLTGNNMQNSNGTGNNTKMVSSIVIQEALSIISDVKKNNFFDYELGKYDVPNYNDLYRILIRSFEDKNKKIDKLKKIRFIMEDYIVGIHKRENNNNVDFNPRNGDGVFQLYNVESKLKNDIYFTDYKNYDKIYTKCSDMSCDSFMKKFIYQLGDFGMYLHHKINTINNGNILEEAIFGRKWYGEKIKGLDGVLNNKMDIYIEKKLWKVFIESYNKYLEKENKMIDNLLNINFDFVDNKYNIKDYKGFIKYLRQNYGFSSYGLNNDFIKTLLHSYQLSVIGAYYNGLGNVRNSRVHMGYNFNFPKTFTSSLGLSSFTFKKLNHRKQWVKDKQVGSVVYYFYTTEQDYFDYIILIKKTILNK